MLFFSVSLLQIWRSFWIFRPQFFFRARKFLVCSLDVIPFLPHTNLEAGCEHNALSPNTPKALVNNIHFINFLVGKWRKMVILWKVHHFTPKYSFEIFFLLSFLSYFGFPVSLTPAFASSNMFSHPHVFLLSLSVNRRLSLSMGLFIIQQ